MVYNQILQNKPKCLSQYFMFFERDLVYMIIVKTGDKIQTEESVFLITDNIMVRNLLVFVVSI